MDIAVSVSRGLKEAVKSLVARYLNRHERGGKDDILILSSPRSGSTWLMELLHAEPGMKYIDEPLGKIILDYNEFLPIRTRWNYLSLTPREEEVLEAYFRRDMEISHFGPRDVFSTDYDFFSDRRVLKVIRANALIEWFRDTFDFRIVYLIRHPVPQGLSCIKRGHVRRVDEFLARRDFVEEHLTKQQLDFALQVSRDGTDLERFVCQWCLENIVPLKSIEELEAVLRVSYEELVIRPEAVFERLGSVLGVSNIGRMMDKVQTPSKTTDSSSENTVQRIKRHDSDYLITKWREKVSQREINRAFQILDVFGIDCYRKGTPLPTDEYLHGERPEK